MQWNLTGFEATMVYVAFGFLYIGYLIGRESEKEKANGRDSKDGTG